MQQSASAGTSHQNGYKMKRILIISSLALISMVSGAQGDRYEQRYEQRYELLVSQLGPAGVGVETVLNNWEKADSTNAKMLAGRFLYYFNKAKTLTVETREEKKYLGMEPMLTLKDSLGKDVFYYQINVFDDELYAQALKAADHAASVWPDKLDFRFMKANAYLAYEKESPDMALEYLLSLVDEHSRRTSEWNYEGAPADDNFFQEAMQEYCYSFFTIGTRASYDAFLKLSQKLLTLYPDNAGYMNNIGSYYLIANKDYKNAFKYYNKVLKAHPDDYTAIKNSIIAARRQKNLRLEKKYLLMMEKYGPEQEQVQARARLANMK